MSSSSNSSFEKNFPGGDITLLEARLLRAKAEFPFPPTPDLAGVERRRLIILNETAASRRTGGILFALALVLIVFLAALLVSPARARVLDWIRIGAVRIFFVPTLTAPVLPATGTPSPDATLTRTPTITPTAIQSVLDIAGETTFAEAQAKAGFPILLPAFPEDLGEPDYVYLQQFNRPVLVLVWMNPDQPGSVRLALSETSSNQAVFEKYDPRSIEETQVNGQSAIWLGGDYLLVARSGDAEFTRLITQGHTLIWTTGEMTFRLETDEDLDTAIRIAESIGR
jgi:hypothetical protein